jgi:hypothetical protein
MFTHHQQAFRLSSLEMKNIIQHVFEVPFEISGYFESKSDLELVPIVSFEKAGMNFVVPKSEKRTIFFHTHPKVCYEHYGSFCGLPSASDLVNLIQDYYDQNSIFNFVFAVEGIYNYQLSKNMMAFLSALRSSNAPSYIFDLIKSQIKEDIHQSGFLQTFQAIDTQHFDPFRTEISIYIQNSLEHWKYFQPIFNAWTHFFETKITIGNICYKILEHLSEHHKNTLTQFIHFYQLLDQKIFELQYTSYLELSKNQQLFVVIDIV